MPNNPTQEDAISPAQPRRFPPTCPSPGAHLDQLWRQTRNHHVTLSQMADQKAAMLITVSSITITLAMGFVRDPAMRWVAATLMLFCIITILLATYVAMPKLFSRRRPDPDAMGTNLQFFGDFAHLDYPTYLDAINRNVHASPDHAYESMVREVYYMGVYLARHKYRFLGWAYLSFLMGILATAAVWTVAQWR